MKSWSGFLIWAFIGAIFLPGGSLLLFYMESFSLPFSMLHTKIIAVLRTLGFLFLSLLASLITGNLKVVFSLCLEMLNWSSFLTSCLFWGNMSEQEAKGQALLLFSGPEISHVSVIFYLISLNVSSTFTKVIT